MVNDKFNEEAQADIEAFAKIFYKKYNLYPTVSFYIDRGKIESLPIYFIENTVNAILLNITSDLKITIKTKRRFKMLNMYRQCTFKIMCDMGYTLYAIGKYFGFNHATVLHARDTVSDYIKLNDTEIIITLNHINNELQKRKSDIDEVL
jgi:hypothetical protein